MGLSRLSAKCRACPLMEKCDHKRLEAEAYLEPSVAASAAYPLVEGLVESVMIKHDYRNVKVAENTVITINLEELKRQIEKEFYNQVGLGIQFGG